MKNRIVCIALVLVLLVSVPFSARAEKPEDFSGWRKVRFSADWSDLKNYINGGRPAFEFILRSNLPDWANYEISTQGRDVSFVLSFSFDSMEDYQQKLQALSQRMPTMVYSTEDGLMLIENITSYDLLNFAENQLKKHRGISEKELNQLFIFQDGSLSINSVTYDVDNAVCIRPEESEAILLDYLSIDTGITADHSYRRKIIARVDTNHGSFDDVDVLETQFSQVGSAKRSTTDDGLKEISVSFDARSQSELEKKTMQCLNASTFIEEYQTAIDSNLVQVERTEFFDLTRLMRTGGIFEYFYDLPSYCSEPGCTDGSATVTEENVTSSNQLFVSYHYQRKFQFSSVDITTDLSDPFGKYTRTITCRAPVDLASDFHTSIKDRLGLELPRGSVLDIYDEKDGFRYYRISFSCRSIRELNEFTQAILGVSDYKMELDGLWIPFGLSTIRDCLATDDILSRSIPAESIQAIYKLPLFSVIDASVSEDEYTHVDGETLTFSIRSGTKISFSFRSLNIFGCISLLFGILTILVILLIFARRHRRRRKNKALSVEPAANPPVPQRTKYCGYCGTASQIDARFCPQCGKELEPPETFL